MAEVKKPPNKQSLWAVYRAAVDFDNALRSLVPDSKLPSPVLVRLNLLRAKLRAASYSAAEEREKEYHHANKKKEK